MATRLTWRLATAALGSALLALPAATAHAAPAAPPPAAMTHVIVTLSAPPALAGATGLRSHDPKTRASARAQANSRADAVRAQHAQLLHDASGLHPHVSAQLSQAINAVAMTVAASDTGALRQLPGVTGVYPDSAMHAVADPDVTITNAPQVWQTTDPQGRPNEGSGEIVAVVDTGIDYLDADLGGGFGPGYKVVAGHDFVNNDDDPMDDNGHGTHVAGIIAGDPAGPTGRTGEAPKAELTAYKVLGAYGTSPESTVLEGFDAAVSADNPYRADVVNMSLSGPAVANDPLEQAADQAVADGVVVVAAAGNDGPGEGTVGSPAEAPGVLAVGASFTGVDLPTVTVTAPEQHTLTVQRMGLSANPPAGGEDADVIDVGSGLPDSYDGVDATGKAVLVGYNPWQLTTVVDTAQQHGAVAVLFATPNYYSRTGSQPGPLPDVAAGLGDDPDKLDIVSVLINGTDATDIDQWLASGPVRIHIGGTDATDLIAAFSAHGPAMGSYAAKPDLVAPGVEIGSTWLDGQYRDDSGTSMAAPHVAGAAALLREAHPDWSAEQVAAALTGGAHRLPGYDVTTAGAGRLDVLASDQLSVLASPRIADLGVADLSGAQLNQSAAVTLTNVSAQPVSVKLAADADAGSPGTVQVTPAAGRIPANGTLTVRLLVHGTAPSTSSDISGRLVATASSGAPLTVPYLLAVRPLDLHVSPDPATGPTTVFVHAEPALAADPVVTLAAAHGPAVQVTATFDHTGWWRADLPAQPAGAYTVTASAPTASGAELTGSATFEELVAASSTGWTSVGPDDQGAYVMAGTSRAGRLYAIPSRPAHAGIFRTDDAGTSWHELRTLPVADGNDMGLAADPTDPDTVYLAVQGGGADPTYQGRILVSHDAGQTWTTLPFPNVAMHDLTIDATGSILTVPAYNGNVYVSTDRGQTWTGFPSPNGFPQQARVIGHDLWIAAGSGLFVVRNVDSDPAPAQQVFTSPVWYHSVEGIVADGGTLVTRTSTDVYVSRDDGATWQESYSAPSTDPFLDLLAVVGSDIYTGGTHGLFVSSDGGASWSPMPTPVPADFFDVASAGPVGSPLIVSAADTGLYRTADGGMSYTKVGLAGATVTALVPDHDATGADALLAGTPNNAFVTPVPSSTVDAATRDWGNGANGGIGFRVTSMSVDPKQPNVVFAGVANAFSRFYVERSTDGGATWSVVENVRVSSRPYQVLVDPANPDYVYVAVADGLSPGLLVSRDGGQTWRKNDLPVLLTSLAGDPHNPDHLWLGGPAGLFETTDEGQTITQLSSTPVSALASDPANPDHLLAGGDGIYVSTDGGHTLRETARSPFRLAISALLIAPDGTIYAADEASRDAGLPVGGRGVLASVDGGRSWKNISAGLADLDVLSLAASPDGRWLYAGTGGGSVYRAGR